MALCHSLGNGENWQILSQMRKIVILWQIGAVFAGAKDEKQPNHSNHQSQLVYFLFQYSSPPSLFPLFLLLFDRNTRNLCIAHILLKKKNLLSKKSWLCAENNNNKEKSYFRQIMLGWPF